jgi:hypothetical protein
MSVTSRVLFKITPFPVSPKGEKLADILLPPWGKVGKGVLITGKANYITNYRKVYNF